MTLGATLPAAVRTRFDALHGPAMAGSRLDRLAQSLGLPAVPADTTPPVTARGGSVAAVFDGTGGADADALWLPPFAAWIETVDADDGAAALAPLMAAAAAADLYVNLSTGTAHDLQLGSRLLAALAARHPLATERRDDIELALHEAVSNALVHGNLGVDGMKELSAAELERFSRDLGDRLADPRLAARRIAITVRIDRTDGSKDGGGEDGDCEDGGGPIAVVEIADDGPGFVPNAVQPGAQPGAPQPDHGASGRGLALIGTIADGLEICDGGRRVRLRFRL
ncbi:ATP-binding protein [Azospirillum sp. TSO35-2]|uniref:ATP-binding protein n=1 Tax=Azospirillum sp. TSO35-2 TaxID=716796 RepID=UPI000D609643|nr:ATP-binding protein [Azospirillum sp. TSO35-2]PWC34291.1 hypothetical protein TSO352_28845 [Azospirillum sp. TSO35-2]